LVQQDLTGIYYAERNPATFFENLKVNIYQIQANWTMTGPVILLNFGGHFEKKKDKTAISTFLNG